MEGGKSLGEQGVGEGGKWESRGWEVGEQGMGSGIYLGGGERGESGSRNKEGDSLLFITGINQSKNTYLAKF